MLVTRVDKKNKYEIAKEIISSLLKDGDKTSNQIYDACLNAGVSNGIMQTVKKKMGIKSVYQNEDWFCTLSPNVEDNEGDIITESELMEEEDEVPVMFLDEVKICTSKNKERPAVLNSNITMQ